jgi:hypothetical protein
MVTLIGENLKNPKRNQRLQGELLLFNDSCKAVAEFGGDSKRRNMISTPWPVHNMVHRCK